jgi:hypothetical protein
MVEESGATGADPRQHRGRGAGGGRPALSTGYLAS